MRQLSASNINSLGPNSTISLAGQFTSADLNAIARTDGGRLVSSGVWDNSDVNASNAANNSPLAKGDIIAFNDLSITGGELSSGSGSGKVVVKPEASLELSNVKVSANIDVGAGGILALTRGLNPSSNAGQLVPSEGDLPGGMPQFAGSVVSLGGDQGNRAINCLQI